VPKPPVAASPAVPDRVPATGAWVLEKTEFVVEKVDPEFMQKYQPSESGEDGAGSAGAAPGGPSNSWRMKITWTPPPRVLIPGKEINFTVTVSDAASGAPNAKGYGSVGANCPSLSAVWYGPAAGFDLVLGERSKEASKVYTPLTASPGDTMYIAAEYGVFIRRNTFYYLYKFTLDAEKASAPVSASSSPRAPSAPFATPPPPPAEATFIGTWNVSFNGWTGVMEITERSGAYEGRFNLRESGWETMLDLRMDNGTISFRRTAGDQRYVGEVSGSVMHGTFSQGGAGSYEWTGNKTGGPR
jgi:hypothetical protein